VRFVNTQIDIGDRHSIEAQLFSPLV
jgi:hypothetical protein